MKTFPPRRILVPLDPSRVARAAWREARALASRFGSELEAVYVWEWLPRSFDEVARPLDPAEMRSLRRQLSSELPEPARVRVDEGNALASILEDAARADLVVMGTHARGRLGTFFIGSMAQAVVRDCPVPVLVIPRREPSPDGVPGSFLEQPVLAPVNFEPYAWEAFRYAAGLAAALKAPLSVLHAQDKASLAEVRRLFREWVERLPVEWRAVCLPVLKLSERPAVDAILEEAPRHGLVVLASHRRSLLGDLFLGTTAQRVLRRSPVPVLAVPAKQ